MLLHLQQLLLPMKRQHLMQLLLLKLRPLHLRHLLRLLLLRLQNLLLK